MDQAKKLELAITATRVRMGILEGVYNAKSGHPGGSLSIADVLTYLYFVEMKVDPENPRWPGRDRFVLSKGHCAPALYAVLAHRGFFPVEKLATLRKLDSFLQGHPDMKGTPGVDMSSGSLGQGISAAVGMALAAKLSGDSYRVYAVLGDGEIQEGQVWEAAMFAAAKGLDMDALLTEIEAIVSSGTRLNLDYYIREQLDEEVVEELYAWFRDEAASDSVADAVRELGDDYSEEEIRLVRLKFLCEVGM